MEEEKNKDNVAGCIKIVLYIFGALALIMIVGGAMEGIGKVLLSIPWYVNIFFVVGIIALLSRIFKW